MLLTPNVLTASMLAYSFSDEWWISTLVGVLTYFFLNLIPHWDPENYQKLIVRVARFIDFLLALIFLLFMVIVIWYKDLSFIILSDSFELNLNEHSFIGALTNLIVYLFFYFFDNKNIKIWGFFLSIDKKLRYVDRSIWGISIQIAVTILSFTIVFGLIDFPSWKNILDQLLR